MKQTVVYMLNQVQQGNEVFIEKIGELQKSIVEEKESYYILK